MILLGSIILIVGGIALLIYTDPQFRLIFGTSGTTFNPSTFTTFARSFNGTFPGNFTGFSGRTGPGASRASALGLLNTTSEIESLVGVALVAVGIVFVGIEMFLTTARSGQSL